MLLKFTFKEENTFFHDPSLLQSFMFLYRKEVSLLFLSLSERSYLYSFNLAQEIMISCIRSHSEP